MKGTVKAIISDTTASVLVESRIQHPLYGKVLKRIKKFLVHIPAGMNIPKEGEMVEVFSSKPISKKKKWTLK